MKPSAIFGFAQLRIGRRSSAPQRRAVHATSTEITAYVNGEIKLDPAKFVSNPAVPGPATAAPTVTSGPKLTNVDIVSLKQAGFGDEVIVSKIRGSGADYKLDVTDLTELKKAGISDAVVAAMLEASRR